MDYRLLLFEDDKYTERVIDGKSLGDVTLFCRAINEAGETELVLPKPVRSACYKRKASGENRECVVMRTFVLTPKLLTPS